MIRRDILEKAIEYTTADRQGTHGKPGDTFARIAELWSAYLDAPVSGSDVCHLMILLKIARAEQNPSHADNWVDIAGYAACGGELERAEP